MNSTRRRWSALVLSLVSGALLVAQTPAVAAGQIANGYINTFEDGTTQGWVTNLLGFGTVPPELVPTNISSGGPAGVDDNYLRLVSIGGSVPGGRLVAINPLNWGGNYLSAGITEIRFDAINLGATDISLRFLLEDPTASPPTNIAVTSAAATLFVGGGWQSVVLPLFGVGALVPVRGTVEGALTNATTARIYHSSLATFPGEPTVAALGIDNIRAVDAVASVPEPSTAVLLAVAVVMFALMRLPGSGRLRLH